LQKSRTDYGFIQKTNHQLFMIKKEKDQLQSFMASGERVQNTLL